MSCILNQLMQEGYSFSDEAIASLSPYLTEHVNRLGRYHLDLERCPPALQFDVPIVESVQQLNIESTEMAQNPSEQKLEGNQSF